MSKYNKSSETTKSFAKVKYLYYYHLIQLNNIVMMTWALKCNFYSNAYYNKLIYLTWKRSQVLEPSPQGVLRVVILKIFVGILTGPLTLRSFSLAPLIKSLHTFSKDFTVREVRVILIRWMEDSSATTAFWSLYAD